MNQTPSSLFFAHEVSTRFSLLYSDVSKKVLGKQADEIAYHNQHAKYRKFEISQE